MLASEVDNFSISDLWTFGARSFLVMGYHLGHCRALSSIPGLHPLDVSSTPPPPPPPALVTTQNASKHCQMSGGGRQNHCPLTTTGLKAQNLH